MVVEVRFAILVAVLVAATPAVCRGQTGPCTKEQQRQVESFLEGRTATAKIDLPLDNHAGLWVYWNGEFDVELYAQSLTKAPVSVPRGRAGTIVDVSFGRNEINVDVNGRGTYVNSRAAERVQVSPEEAYRMGSRIAVTFGRRLTEQDCRIESVVLALDGVVAIAGAEAIVERAARAAGLLPPAPTAETVGRVPAAADRPAATTPTPAQPNVALLAAEVQPMELAPGDEVKLSVHFQLAGLAPGTTTSVLEERQLYFQDRPLFSDARSATRSWPDGTHTTTFSFQFPESASAGVYRFVVSIQTLGQTLEKDAAFVVRAR